MGERPATGEVPYGYQKIIECDLESDPHPALMMTLIFELRSKGQSSGSIAERLNTAGVSTKRGRIATPRQ